MPSEVPGTLHMDTSRWQTMTALALGKGTGNGKKETGDASRVGKQLGMADNEVRAICGGDSASQLPSTYCQLP